MKFLPDLELLLQLIFVVYSFTNLVHEVHKDLASFALSELLQQPAERHS